MVAYKQIARKFFAQAVGVARERQGLSQEEMAELLRVSARAYGDLERGKYMLSALSLLFFLITLETQEVAALLAAFRRRIEQEDWNDVA